MGKAIKAVVAGVVVKQLIKFGKQAIDLASDLQEVQNVVDVAFGSMSSEIDAFAKNALKQFGLSELSAKKMASTFMAMSNGMGISADAGKTMSIQLTGLAADMASFYNVSQDVAQTALNSVFTGETESLKKFGVVMSQANLEAFALSRGIKKAYSEMSQAEQVTLRYNYVLQATANAQNDFSRTTGSWANQVRLLKEQWSQLIGTIGKGLIAALTPVVKFLNTVLGYIVAIANAIAKVFGGSGISSSVGSAADSAGDLSAGAGSTAENLDEANGSAKKLKKTLAGFDELEILNSDDSSGSGSDAIGGGAGGFDLDSYFTPDTSQDGMVDEMAKKVEAAIARIKEVFKSLEPIFKAFGEGLNGQQILQKLKEIVDGAKQKMKEFGDTLDFSKYIPTITAFAGALGNLINTVANGLLDIISNVGGDLFDAFSPALTEFINNTIPTLISVITSAVEIVSTVIDTAVQLLLQAWDTVSPIFDLIGQIILNIQQDLNTFWTEYGEPITTAIQGIIVGIGDSLSNFWDTICDPIISNIIDSLEELWNQHLRPIVQHILEIIGELILMLTELWNNVLKPIIDWLVSTFGPMFVGVFNNIWNTLSAIVGNILDAIDGLLTAFEGIITFLSGVFTGDWEKAWEGIKLIFKGIFDSLVNIVKVPMNLIIGIINTVISAITSVINLCIRGINKIKVTIPDWVPGLGGKTFGFNLSELSAYSIPMLAKGGVISQPTVAMIGEYAGASNNPEIVTPQNILRDIMVESNGEVVSVLYQMCNRVIAAIENVDMNVSIGDETIAQSASRGNQSYLRRTGKPLFSI